MYNYFFVETQGSYKVICQNVRIVSQFINIIYYQLTSFEFVSECCNTPRILDHLVCFFRIER